MKLFTLKGDAYQVNVIIVRKERKDQMASEPITKKPKAARKPRRPKAHQVQIKKEAEDPQQHEDPLLNTDDFDLPPPDELFRLLSQTLGSRSLGEVSHPQSEHVSPEIGQEIGQEIDQELGQEIDQEISRESPTIPSEPIPYRRRRVISNASSVISPPRTRKRHQLNA